ncbi:MAG TPA: EstP, partial [Pseudoalteromonas sp.]
EQEREKRSIQKRLDFYAIQEKHVGVVFNSLEPKLRKFKAAIKKLKSMGVKASSVFPNSMTFVQNPDYQFIHSGYKKIRELTSLTDDDLLLSLERIEEIGLINMPLLYERWCLLQLIKVLVQNYGYTPTDDWKKELINIIETKQNYQSLVFKNDNLKRTVKLSYEPMLENGKTPDFVMDVFFIKKNGEDYKKRFVMDAKFYSNSVLQKAGGVSGVVKQLYKDKDYSEEGRNTVFIIHPVKSAITEKVSPQSWGNNSYYGELALFDWDKNRKEYFHQYGAICANPIERLNYLDEFQRMIGMFLQYGIENNTLNGKVDDVESLNFCVACGSHDLTLKINNRAKSAWYECNQCKHFTTYNHCNSCDTRLIKNGDYWTYHSQMPMEPLNIKCPSCESLL